MSDFSEAMRWILDGKRARRKDWNRPSHVIFTKFGSVDFFVMVMKDGAIGSYTPSHCDMKASDWYLLEGSTHALSSQPIG